MPCPTCWVTQGYPCAKRLPDRIETVDCPFVSDAMARCPWASVFLREGDAYICFQSKFDYERRADLALQQDVLCR